MSDYSSIFSVIGSGVLLLTDSIGRFVANVDGLEVWDLPGFTITKMTGECERDNRLKLKLKQKKAVIVHVGTNDIHKLDPGQMVSNLNNLFFRIREENKDIEIMYSAILPRPCDSDDINKKVKNANVQIEKMCKARKFPFLHTFRPFVDKQGLCHRHMFAARDRGLHLNLEGVRVLSNFYLQVVKRIR